MKKKKQRLEQWDKPKYDWPPRMPRPTMHVGKTLLNHIDSQERNRIEADRPFSMPNYQTGDVIDLTYFHSLSEGKFNTFRGLVIGRKKPNNLRESLKFHTVIDGEHVTIDKKVMSPMLAKIDVVKYGSNKLRKKLNHIPALELSEKRLHEPIIKGRGYKPRSAKVSKKFIEDDTSSKKKKI